MARSGISKVQGFSLVEVLLVVAILAIVTLGVASTLSLAFKGVAGLNKSQEALRIYSGTLQALSNSRMCPEAMKVGGNNVVLPAAWANPINVEELYFGRAGDPREKLAEINKAVNGIFTKEMKLNRVSGPFPVRRITAPGPPAVFQDRSRYYATLKIKAAKDAAQPGDLVGGQALTEKIFYVTLETAVAGGPVLACSGTDLEEFYETICTSEFGAEWRSFGVAPWCLFQKMGIGVVNMDQAGNPRLRVAAPQAAGENSILVDPVPAGSTGVVVRSAAFGAISLRLDPPASPTLLPMVFGFTATQAQMSSQGPLGISSGGPSGLVISRADNTSGNVLRLSRPGCLGCGGGDLQFGFSPGGAPIPPVGPMSPGALINAGGALWIAGTAANVSDVGLRLTTNGVLHVASTSNLFLGSFGGLTQLVGDEVKIESSNRPLALSSTFRIVFTAPDIRASTNVVVTSDRQTKYDVVALAKAVHHLMRLRPVAYTSTYDKERHMGFIAQEVEEVFPELVRADPNTGLKGLDYTGLIAPLTAVAQNHEQRIQELERQNADLRRELATQRGALDELRRGVSELKRQKIQK